MVDYVKAVCRLCLASGVIRPASYTDDLALTRRTRYVFIPSFFRTFFQEAVSIAHEKNLIKGHNTLYILYCYMPYTAIIRFVDIYCYLKLSFDIFTK